MQAILSQVAKGSTMIARNLKDASVAKALEAAHRSALRAHGDAVANARSDPSPGNLQAFYDLLAAGIRDIHAVVVSRTSPQGQMAYDADALLNDIRAANTDSMLDYICEVDALVNNFRTLRGDVLFNEACSTGLLTGLLTGFVSRLNYHYQEKAVSYWNNVARMFTCDGPQRDALPNGLRRRLDEMIAQAGATNEIAPNFGALARFDGELRNEAADAAYANLARVCTADARSPLVRIMHVAADLYWVPASLLLLSHWDNSIRELRGGYVASQRRLTSTINHVSGDGDAHDERDDDEPDMAPVQTRAGPGAAAATGGGGVAGGSGIARGNSRRPGERDPVQRTRFDPRAIDRFERQADKVSAGARADVVALSDKMTRRIDDLERLFDKALARNAQAIELQDQRIKDRSAHLVQTLEKHLQNIAANTTDLRLAPPLKVTAAELGSLARTNQAATAAVAEAVGELAAVDAQISAVTRDRTSTLRVDADGFKLSHLPPNRFDAYSQDSKDIHAARDNVRGQAEFDKISDGPCVDCPHDARSQPHRRKHCPFHWSMGTDAVGTVDARLVERRRQTMKDNKDRLSRGEAMTMAVCEDTGDDDAECIACMHA